MQVLRNRIGNLSAAKKRLFDLRFNSAETFPLIERRKGQQVWPLSFAQRRMWLAQQLEAGSSAYNIHDTVRLIGILDGDALWRSLDEIVRRHEVLRTGFAIENGEPVQIVGVARHIARVTVDLTTLPSGEREEQVLRLASQEARTPFELQNGRLFRAKLMRLTAEDHVLVLTMHHIISDGWSLGVLVRELATLYDAYKQGREAELPELPIQYGDYAEWQRRYLTGAVLDRQLNYWRERLGCQLPILALPSRQPRSAVRSFRASQYAFELGPGVTEGLKDLSRRLGATLFMTIAAAYAALLVRYTNQEDQLVGTPIANRTRVETEDLIGCFMNTLVLRINAAGNPTFADLLGHVRQIALEAYAHQDVPFEKLVEELQVSRDASHTPLFQTMLVLQNFPIPELQLTGLRIAPVKFDREAAKYDLTLSLGETPEGLVGVAQFNCELFHQDTIRQLIGHWQQMLAGIVKNPRLPIWEYEIITASEQKQFAQWNRTETAYDRDKTVVQLFSEQAKNTPKRMVVRSEDDSLTYEELDSRSNQLAHWLRDRGVSQEVMVGVATKRCVEMLVAIFGILKAGGAYVALDPESPRERLQFMLEDTGIKVLLTQKRWRERLPAEGKRVLCLDADWVEIEEQSSADLDVVVRPNHLAYVLYTSGSTGQPKGVMVEHRSLLNYVNAVSSHYDFPSYRSFAIVQPLTVDSIITMLYPALLHGGCLHLISESCASDARAIAEYFRVHEIDCLKIAPPHLASLHAYSGQTGVMPRKVLIIGGERARRDWAESLLAAAPDCRIFNHYGPTEATVGTLTLRVDAKSLRDSPAYLPIGKPLANCKAYILDRHCRRVPVGVVGELYLGGDCLARGYLHRPDLTARSFVPDPFQPKAAARMYKTGDLARFQPDGNIEFLGRCDHQVKIRGFRIELGEVESMLAKHPDIGEVVVLAPDNNRNSAERLVAYFVPASNRTPSPAELRHFLQEKLPSYMIPSAFAPLKALPRSSHGKFDLNAFPRIDVRHAVEREYVCPRNATERLIATIWCEVLGISDVGIHENFFHLGGHSLLATQVVSRIRDAFQMDLPLMKIFETPTIEDLAAAIESGTRRTDSLAASIQRRKGTAERSRTPLSSMSS